MSGNKPAGEITEHKLVHGWASAPRVRVRQAVASDLPAVAKLAVLAGVQLDDYLADAVIAGTAGMALRAGLRGGWDGFTRCMAEQFFAYRDDPLPAYLAAALVLVAEHRDRSVVGALIAYPPAHVAQDHLGFTRHIITDPRERGKLVMVGATAIAKVKAVAVDESARGHNIGGSLLKRCKQVYSHCRYQIIYGQMPPVPGLDAFYRRNGFEVLAKGAELDLWVVFGVHSRIRAGQDERFFIHQPAQLP
jgi:GNAT superfamily N-acetyltransferase